MVVARGRLHRAQLGRIARGEAPVRRRRRGRASAGGRWPRCCPGLRDAHQPDFVVVNGENAAGGVGITEKTARELLEHGRRRDHARQPRLPPPRGLRLPRPRGAHRAAGQLPEGQPRAAGTPSWSATAMRLGVVNLSGTVFLEAVRSPVRGGRRAAGRAARPRRPRARGHARRGHEREGGDGLAPRRARHACVGTHTHVPTADARVLPGRHRLHHRRGDDRAARRRDRREARAGARALPHAHARALRDLGRGSVAERRASRGGRRRAARRHRAAAAPAGRSARSASTSTPSSAASRSATSATGNGSRSPGRSSAPGTRPG